MLTDYSQRRSIEETNQAAKTHLGLEQPQAWTQRAVLRTAPLAMLLYSLVVLWFAQYGHAFYQALPRPWFRRKIRPSFADMLTTLRRLSLRETLSNARSNPAALQQLLDTIVIAV